jgi:hypothetical protein
MQRTPEAPVKPALVPAREKSRGLPAALVRGAVIGAAVSVLAFPLWRSMHPPGAVKGTITSPVRMADFRGESASADAQYVANWVVDSNNNQQLSFVILDKLNTKVFVFDAAGKLLGATPVLIGAAKGDDSADGIGGKPLSQVQQNEKTTPAGRFMGEPGRNLSGEDVVWVDYDAAVSMHRVRANNPAERRLERLASPTTEDNRISYGCINMPVPFFENVLKPVFNQRYGVVYVLPEVKNVREVFTSSYDVAARHARAGALPSS